MNRYEELKKINYEKVFAEIYSIMEDEFLKDNFYMVLLCYILWKLKIKQYNSPVLMLEQAFEIEKSQCYFDYIEDVLFYLDESDKWKDVVTLSDKYSEEEIASCVVFITCNEEERMQDGLLQLIDSLLEITDNDYIGEYLARDYTFNLYSKSKHPNSAYKGHECSHADWNLAVFRKEVLHYRKYETACNISEEECFDKIFINSEIDRPYDIRGELDFEVNEIWENFPKQVSFVWECCGIAVHSLKESGRAVAIITAGDLSGKSSERVRKFLIKNKYIEGVIALPDKMFTSTWINTYLVILKANSEKVKFCDAREFYIKSRNNGKRINIITNEIAEKILDDYLNIGKNTALVSNDVIVENNDSVLMPQRYVKNNSFENVICLEEVTEKISRGISLSASEIDELLSAVKTRNLCIFPSCISNGIISNVFYLKEQQFKIKINTAYPGDVIISKTGNPYKAAVADNYYIVIGNLYILRVDAGKMNPYYLKCFLESEKGQKELEKMSVGAKTPLISVGNLKKIQIPIYKPDKQTELESMAEDLTHEMEKQYKEFNVRMGELNNLFQ